MERYVETTRRVNGPDPGVLVPRQQPGHHVGRVHRRDEGLGTDPSPPAPLRRTCKGPTRNPHQNLTRAGIWTEQN